MNPDVNININLGGASADVSRAADSATGLSESGPPPEMHNAGQASTLGREQMAPGPEDSNRANSGTEAAPGPEAINAGGSVEAGSAAAPPPFELSAGGQIRGGANELAPGPDGSYTAASSNSAPGPDLNAAESAPAVKKSVRKKISNKTSRAKKKK